MMPAVFEVLLFILLFIYLFIHLFIYLSIYLLVCLFIYLFIYLLIYLFTYLFIYFYQQYDDADLRVDQVPILIFWMSCHSYSKHANFTKQKDMLQLKYRKTKL